jgi:hypothetical protein
VNKLDISVPDYVITAIEILGGSAIGNAIAYYYAHKPALDKLAADAEVFAADLAALKNGPAK